MSLASQLSFLESNTSTIQQINNNIVIAGGTFAASTTTGALQITNGGLGVGGGAVFGGTVTATTFIGAFAGTITGTASTATNLAGGTVGQLPYQTGVGATSFTGPGSYGQFLMSTGASAPVYQSTLTQVNGNIIVTSNSAATSTATGALQIANGGLGVGGAIYSGGNISIGVVSPLVLSQGIIGQSGGNLTLQSGSTSQGYTHGGLRLLNNGGAELYGGNSALSTGTSAGVWLNGGFGEVSVTKTTSAVSTDTGALRVLGGIGVWGNGFFGGVVTATTYYGTFAGTIGGSVTINTATNLAGGTPFQIPYQSAPSTTAFASSGTTGQFWQATTNGAPTWTTTANIYVANAAVATNIRAGTPFQIPYQSGSSTTAFANSGTTGQFWQATTNGAPTWTSTSSIYVNSARFSDELTGGAAGSIPYQSGANDTTFLAIGTNGFILTSNGSAPAWQAISGLSAGNATTATNLAAGTVGQIPFQTSAGATSFFGAGTAGQLLMSAGTTSTGPVFTNTSSIYVNSSRFADELTGGAAGGLPYQSGANDTTFLAVGSAGNFLTVNSAGTAPQWSSTATSLFGYSQNIAGGQAWQIPYQSAPSTTAFASSGTTGQFWQATTNGAPAWTTTANIYVANAVVSTNLRSGAAGSLPYQSAASTTAFLGIGTNGFVLTSNGSAPTWAALSGLASGSATTATNLAGGTAGQLPYQSAVGVTAFTGPGSYGQFLMSTGANAPVYQSTLTQANGNIIITSNTAATSTTTGALQVVNGGVGIGGSVFVGGNISVGTPTLSSWDATSRFIEIGGTGNALWGYGPSDIALLSGMYYNGGYKYASTGPKAAGFEIVNGSHRWYTDAVGGTKDAAAPATQSLTLANDGNFSVGYTSAQSGARLSVNGGVFVNGTLTATNFVGSFTGGVTGAASQVQTTAQAASAVYYPTFVDTNNASATAETVWTTSSFTINPGTKAVSVGGQFDSVGVTYLGTGVGGDVVFFGPSGNRVVFNSTGGTPSLRTESAQPFALYAGTFGIGGLTINNAGGTVTINTNSNATSTTTGALRVVGGVGVGGTLMVNERITIGTTSTANKFEVVGTAGQLFSVTDTFTGTIFSANDVSGIPSIEVLDTGLVKLAQYNGQVTISTGTAVSGSGLSVWTSTYILSLGVGTSGSGTIGEIRATNEVTAYYSDRRLKENVQVIDNAVTKVLSLNGITYSPNDLAASYGYDKNVKLVGLFADEVEAVLPEATRPAPFDQDESGNSKSGKNYKTIQYEKLVPLLIEAIKEQQKSIDLLRDELYQLKNRK